MSFFLMFAGFCLGLLAKRFNRFNAETPQTINKVIINIALPAMILLKVPALQIDLNALAPVGFAWLVIILCATIIILLAKLFKWPAAITGALLLIVPLSNSAYFGVPMINAISDDHTVRYAIMYDQFGSFFGLAIYAPIVIALLSNQEKFRPMKIVKSVFMFTPFPVILISLFLLNEHSLPGFLESPLHWLASTMGPAAAFVVGYSLKFELPTKLRRPLLIAIGLKLIFAPLIVLFASELLGTYPPAQQASIVQSAMPSMITAGLVAIAAGYNEKLIIATTAATTAISIISLPIFMLVAGMI